MSLVLRLLAIPLIFLVCATVVSASTNSAPAQADPRQVWQLLDYLSVDYPAAVSDGQVLNASEFREMQEFAASVRTHLAALPDRTGRTDLLSAAAALEQAIATRSPPGLVSSAARKLADDLLVTYPIPLAPAATPDLARGKQLYLSDCSACHGATGAADGALAQTLDPRPVAFTDTARARQRSPFSYYQIISQGIEGTAMARFSSLPESDRWALAFFVSTLPYADSERRAGQELWQTRREVRTTVPNLETIARSSEDQISTQLGSTSGTVLAYLRSHPDAVGTGNAHNIELVRSRLTQSVKAYSEGQSAQAQRLALSAYLDGIEPIEPVLAATNAQLLSRVESAMAEFRSALNRGATLAVITAQSAQIEGLLAEVDQAVTEQQGSSTTAFLGSFTILVREGLEALLIVVAIVAFLGKARRTDLMPYVHGGWIGALLAGVVTWAIATYLVNITGANRETTEGVSSLLAAAVLLSVGLWMHGKSVAGRWQQYLREKLSNALSQRSAWFLAGLAFLAVYREVFETILFYAALWTQGGHHAILAGLGVGSLALALIAYGLLRATRRLPISQFFAVSSLFIGVLAVVLVGKGVAALQEAGLVQLHTVDGPRLELLGIYPSVQTLLAQLAVVVFAVIGFTYNHVGMRRVRAVDG